MTSESKILTVSYGTFSCTLEGFDDPFNAMKAIAEYFRDLAAEDRYFGAEPPQPDAAMLHRIAEREVSRLVDTRVRDNSVYLRPKAGTATSLPADTSGTQSATDAPLQARFQDNADDMARFGSDDANDAVDEPSVEPSLQDVIPEGVAAKLARLRQSVTPSAIAAPLPDELLEQFMDAPEVEAPVTADFSEDLPESTKAEEDAPRAPGADALNRLGSLLQQPQTGDDQETYVEDQVEDSASLLVEEAEAALVEVLEDPEWTEPDLTEPEAEIAPVEAVADESMPEGDVSAARDMAGWSEEDLAVPESIFADNLPEDEPAVPASLVEALDEDPTPELVADQMSEPAAGSDDEIVLDAEELADSATDPAANVPQSSAATGAGKSKRVSSRVVRIHPDDEDDAPVDQPDPNTTRILAGSGEDAEVARLLRQADDVMADTENRRRLDSIAHLKAAVVATEADRATTGDAKSSATAKLDPYRDDLAHVVQPDTPPPADVKPRRKTVSVRPQEPRPGTIRSGMVSPPPLVLVSEQRIDRASPTPTPAGQPMVALRTGRLTGAIGMGAAAGTPAQPHRKLVLERVPGGNQADLDDEDDGDEDLTEVDEAGLASFAERVGVKSMVEMLEAAAAYATCIEKRGQFTRPQLMRRLMASVGGRPISREDGLRSFGTLLRTGRIEKISRGQYTLAESSPYLAEARRFS
ncbi:hypothetical protein [Tabrizicola sp.]|uniref:hypothetical protein n=1 Tax=Tabrizicola sp. TaxID=2005166 RepID=UPI002632BA43|nr:hypothetical protein [Tabrizicola sp.]MDM7932056.1 hypothetical protein [Tabrizicola sp.]